MANTGSIFCNDTLLRVVQNSNLFEDSKTFVDLRLRTTPDETLKAFADLNKNGREPTTDEVHTFVRTYFEGPGTELIQHTPEDWNPNPYIVGKVVNPDMKIWMADLNAKWKDLSRKIHKDVHDHPERHSLIPLPHPFVIPGGRFRELYYWDSYWVINGLLLCDMFPTVKGMLSNLLYMVQRFGHVPNGTRVYYITRSQPPFLIPMVDAYVRRTSDLTFLKDNIHLLEKEYNFWEDNRTIEVIKNGEVYKMARYNVDQPIPRPESYREDVKTTAGLSQERKREIFSNLASACESGMDFSTRWLPNPIADKNTNILKSIKTNRIIPVELNALLYWNAVLLSNMNAMLGLTDQKEMFRKKAELRQRAIDAVLWNESRGIWLDYDIDLQTSRDFFFASNIIPLFVGCYGNESDMNSKVEVEEKVIKYLKDEKVLDYPGGMPSSKIESGEQWDFPNAWPPLQQMIIEGLSNTKSSRGQYLARELAEQWVKVNWKIWKENGNMYEKYDVTMGEAGSGGEYDVQTGFGWSNGVVMMLLDKYPDLLLEG
ncbi:unnamed protein product [Owenia fusiformis]|uniref:Trehalase n=1 Tax=Owenia fusiformis TaxID=6347 RepID=A0A8S4PXR0_OWEFU|nr:unnamed protein product [Owenia fusiformis]